MTRTTIALLLCLATPLGAAAQDAASPDPASADPASPDPAAQDMAVPSSEPSSTTGSEPMASGPAPAIQEPAPAADDFRNAWITIGLRGGVYLPGLVNAFDPHASLTVDFAVLLPVLDRMLGIYGDVNWSPPGRSQSALSDPRVGPSPGPGTWTYTMQTDQLYFSLGLIFRFLTPGSMFVPYISAGGRVYLLKTAVDGTGAGNAFGLNTEQSTQVGFTASLGGELRLGPGALVLDVGFGYSDLPHDITGPTSTTALAIQLGYRIFL